MSFLVQRLGNLYTDLNGKESFCLLFLVTKRNFKQTAAEGPGTTNPSAQHLFEKPGDLVPGEFIPILIMTIGPEQGYAWALILTVIVHKEKPFLRKSPSAPQSVPCCLSNQIPFQAVIFSCSTDNRLIMMLAFH